MEKEHWVIHVGGGYGSFMVYATEADAEEKRADKANQEHAVAWKRRANAEELAEGKPMTDFNNRDEFMALAPAA